LELLYSGSARLPSTPKQRIEIRKCLTEWKEKYHVNIYQEDYENNDENPIQTESGVDSSQTKKEPAAKIKIPPDIVLYDYKKGLNNPNFGDIILLTNNDVEITLHRIILSCSTPYFSAMLCPTWNDRTAAGTKFYIDMDSVVLEVMLSYIYSGSLPQNISGETILRVMVESEMLGLVRLQKLCINYVTARITESNCTALLAIAQHYKIRDLEIVCNHYLKNIVGSSKNKEFSDYSMVTNAEEGYSSFSSVERFVVKT